MTKVLLTGGGTAGHVTPNLALVPYLKDMGMEIEYIGSYNGIEKKLAQQQGIPYFGIDSGKFRRYLSLKNVTDLHHIQKGYHEAIRFMKEHKPDVVFSKGGFVTVPVVKAAAKNKIPVVIHESDMSPGLANKLCYSSASIICYNFPETAEYFSGSSNEVKSVHTGLPIRDELLNGNAENGRKMCGFNSSKPVLMVMGGSLGAVNVNNAVWGVLPQLLEHFQIVHLCGKGKMDEQYSDTEGYIQFEYISEELKDLLALSDVLISRAGANAIWEIAALHKPALLIPLGTDASRGDQLLNAGSFERLGFSKVLLEENLTKEALLSSVKDLYENRDKYIEAMKASGTNDAAKRVALLIAETAKNGTH